MGLVLLTVALTGCIGPDDLSTNIDRTENNNESGGCSTTSTDGIVRPGQPVWADERSPEAPNRARIDVTARPIVGTLDMVLERDGHEVWSDQLTGVGTNSRGTQVTDLEPGPYRLTARTDSGAAQVQLELAISWGDGRCT